MNTTSPLERLTRRRFLGRTLATLVATLPLGSSGRANARPGPGSEHPDPRPGIDASNVLTADDLTNAPEAIPIYDGSGHIPAS